MIKPEYDHFDHVYFDHNPFDNDNKPRLCINCYLNYFDLFEDLFLSTTIENYQSDQK